MTYKELNNYIKYYLEEDKTNTAIMLSGAWGTGKSYYIENELIPFIDEKKCIVISLYGINETDEISKSIYLEKRFKPIKTTNEIATTGKVVAKTILKGLLGKLGFDFDISNNDTKEIYESIDLSDTLLVFEDFERSGIDIIEFLGYINNLVEKDGVKVLIVANENEILGDNDSNFEINELRIGGDKEEPVDDEEEKRRKTDIKKYIKIKEKTIGDTFAFSCDLDGAVRCIIKDFKNDKIEKILLNDSAFEETIGIVKANCNGNLRTFKYGLQKIVGILSKIPEEYKCEEDFFKSLAFGTLLFVSKIRKGELLEWNGNERLSFELACNRYPLFRFCYDYIIFQKTISDEDFEEAYEEYLEKKKYEGTYDDKDISILSNWFIKTDAEVRKALESIKNRLNDKNSIGLYNYGNLAYWLVLLSGILEFDYSEFKRKMIENIKGESELNEYYVFDTVIKSRNTEKYKGVETFINDLKKALKEKEGPYIVFSYKPDDIKEFYHEVVSKTIQIKSRKVFISEYEVDKIIDMLSQASSEQIDDFRGVLLALYRDGIKKRYVEDDICFLKKINEKIENEENRITEKMDNIQKQQLKMLYDNINDFIGNKNF